MWEVLFFSPIVIQKDIVIFDIQASFLFGLIHSFLSVAADPFFNCFGKCLGGSTVCNPASYVAVLHVEMFTRECVCVCLRLMRVCNMTFEQK